MNEPDEQDRQRLVAQLDEIGEGLRRLHRHLARVLEESERRSKRIEANLRRSGLLRD
jgi:hypothetical protein